MPRIARTDIMYNGCYAHIISRSIRKMKLFKDEEDFQNIYRLLEFTKKRAGYKIYHYCFMQTHIHLAVSVKDIKAFSNAMGYVKSQYSYMYHSKYRLSGPIWRERYKGILIEDENYMRVCGAYIENNPVKAGLVKNARDWKFSSNQHYCGEIMNELIDDYEGIGEIGKAIEIEFEEKEFFEQGRAIGSPFFRFQVYEKMKRG
jgi:putative transposase